jgi:hypothetical protein
MSLLLAMAAAGVPGLVTLTDQVARGGRSVTLPGGGTA